MTKRTCTEFMTKTHSYKAAQWTRVHSTLLNISLFIIHVRHTTEHTRTFMSFM